MVHYEAYFSSRVELKMSVETTFTPCFRGRELGKTVRKGKACDITSTVHYGV